MYGRTEHLHTERSWRKRRIIIDAAEIAPDKFEVMVLYKSSGKEIESATTRILEEAEQIYKEYCEKYEQKPEEIRLTGKYLKLKEDLEKAVELAEIAVAGQEDNGTCNFDACSLKLPRWRESLVKQAAKEAGTGCFVWDLWGKKRFVFTLPHVGQANRRSIAANTMTEYLKRIGYDSFEYCAMD